MRCFPECIIGAFEYSRTLGYRAAAPAVTGATRASLVDQTNKHEKGRCSDLRLALHLHSLITTAFQALQHHSVIRMQCLGTQAAYP
jgi:hypothetical protein